MEPKVQIGNYVISEAQAMAVRVAVSAFQAECAYSGARNSLGPIADAYRDRLGEVLKIWLTK